MKCEKKKIYEQKIYNKDIFVTLFVIKNIYVKTYHLLLEKKYCILGM